MATTEWSIRRTAIGQKSISVVMCDDDPDFTKTFYGEIESAFIKLNLKADISAFSNVDDIPTDLFASCNMAFLDIDFEGEDINGIDIARHLRKVNKNAIIFFVTNFIDYAPAGYEIQAFRYILKRDRNDVLERYIMQATEQLADNREYLALSDGDVCAEIPLDDISYLEVLNHEISVHTTEGDLTLYASLSSLEEQLDKCGFLRIHNSYLVNMRYIQKYRSRECLLTDGTSLPVSERNYSAQKQKYLLWKGLK